MAYPQLEELTSRKREKVALFFTAEHMAGVLAIGLPAYIATLGTMFWLRVVILLAAAVLGLLITSDLGGMAGYERAVWWARGRLRRRLAGSTLRPAEFTAAPVIQGDRAMALGGPIRRVKGREALGPARPWAMTTARTVLPVRTRSVGPASTGPSLAAVDGTPPAMVRDVGLNG